MCAAFAGSFNHSLVLAALLPVSGAVLGLPGEQHIASSEEFVAECSITDLQSNYNLRHGITSYNGEPRLSSYAHAFRVEANVAASLAVSYEVVTEPQGFVAETKRATIRQKPASEYRWWPETKSARSPNSLSSPLALSTPGVAAASVYMLVMAPEMPPGNYEYRVTLTCLQ